MKWKKVLSVLLALCVVLSMTVMPAFAEETGTEAIQENSFTAESSGGEEQDVPDGDAVSAPAASDEGTDDSMPAEEDDSGTSTGQPAAEDDSRASTGQTAENNGGIAFGLTAVNNIEVSTWAELQQALIDGGNITLKGNITAASDDNSLEVPAEATVTLDLNGYKIDRALLNNPKPGGFVLQNRGTLTITDSSGNNAGKITGGNNSTNYDVSAGGGICNLGTLTLAGGSISENHSEDCAGVYNAQNCTFNMTGGTISNNTAEYEGGGIGNYGTVNMSDGDILQNTAGTRGGGIFTSGSYASVNMSGGGIVWNTAGSNGGGIYADESEVAISDGIITLNNATSSSAVEDPKGFGGGIYAYLADITITGGKINGNNRALKGGGAYIGYGCSLTMSGSPVISGNVANGFSKDLYLDDNNVINVNDAFTESAEVWVYAAQESGATITSGYSEYNTLNPASVFTASVTNLDVLLDALGEVWIGEGLPISLTKYAEKEKIEVPAKATFGATVNMTFRTGTKPVVQYNANKQTVNVEVTDEGNGKWSFTMPNSPVAVDIRYTGVPYIGKNWNGAAVASSVQTCDEARPVPDDGKMTSGWYYLNSNVTKNDRIESITGDINLILGDGYTLNVKGLYVPPNTTLTIYGQRDDDEAGKIDSHPSGGAGIGGYSGHDNGNIVIKGGIIDAFGYDNCAGIGSNDGQKGGDIEIYGGIITAKGGKNGAGIGGGRKRSGGNITIYNGWVEASGGDDAAGIGGGEDGDGGNITIYHGTIQANNDPNENAAAIGGGNNGDGGTITIKEGNITVHHRDGAGIGGGEDGDGGDITISGGDIYCSYASGTQGNGAGIGGGNHGGNGGNITINFGDITIRSNYGAGIGGGRSKGGFAPEYNNSGDGGNITIHGGFLDITSRRSFAIGAGAGPGEGNPDGNNTGASGNIKIYGGDLTLKGHAARADDPTFERTSGIGGDTGDFKMYGGTIKCEGNSHILWNIGKGSILIDGGKLDGGMIETKETVKINGGELRLKKTKSDKPCIYAKDGLTLDGGIMVQAGTERSSQTPVQANKRVNVLTDQNSKNKFFSINTCDHPDLDYSIDENAPSTHTAHCKYCTTVFEPEAHIYNEQYVCTVCGYTAAAHFVTFHPYNGMYDHTEVVVYGETVTRPEDPVRPGYRFLGWYQVTSEISDIPFDFSTPIIGNTDLGAKWEVIKPEIKAHGLLLSDEIGVKFRVAFPEGFDTTNFRIDFTAGEGRSGSMTYYDSTAIEGSTDRYFIFRINALELADTITATLYCADGQTIEDQYSAMNYIQYVQNNWRDNTKLLDLINSLQAYGYYMQKSGWTDGRRHTEIPEPAAALDGGKVSEAAGAVSGFTCEPNLEDSGIEDATFSLVLNAQTLIHVSVRPEEGVTITSADWQLIQEIEKEGETWYQFSSPRFGPKNLGKDYTVSIVTDRGTATVKASAMAYVNEILKEGSGFTGEQKYAMAAYYYYYAAARDY